MLQIAIISDEGKAVQPKDLQTLAELEQAVERARQLIRECERLADAKRPPRAPMRAPYS